LDFFLSTDEAFSTTTMSNLNTCLFNGATLTAKQFLDSGIDINTRDENGQYPICAAIASDNSIVVAFVISNGADVNIDIGDGWTPLHEAFDSAIDGMIQANKDRLSRETLEIIDLLIKNGADMDKTNASGKTPLDSLNTYSATIERFNFLKNIFRETVPSIDNKIKFERNAH
jgi:ankyrin repeat protein